MARTTDTIQTRILAIIDGQPAATLRSVFERMEFSDLRDADRVNLARATLIEYLNRNRKERARRLFTGLFDAFLTGDPALLRSQAPLPGLFHRIDIGGLWRGLLRFGLGPLAEQVQRDLDGIAAAMLLEQALVSPQAVAMQETLRVSALTVVDQVRASPRAAEEFLALVNRDRMREATRVQIYPTDIYHLDRPYLNLIAGYLRGWQALSEHALAMRRCCAGPAGTNADDLARTLADAVVRVQEAAEPGSPVTRLAPLVPLALLHAAHRYDVVAIYLRYADPGSPSAASMTAGLLGHLDAVLMDVEAILLGALKVNERVAGAPIRLAARERAACDAGLLRTGAIIDAAATAGLLEMQTTAPVLQSRWHRFTRLLAGLVLPVQVQRFTVAIMARDEGAIDHDATLWLTRHLFRWEDLGRSIEPDRPSFPEWRSSRLDDLTTAADRAFRFDGRETLADRVRHLRRLNDFQGIFGGCAGKSVPVSSQNAIAIVRYCLTNPALLGERELGMVGDFVTRAEAELAQVRNWKNADLLDLVRLARLAGDHPGP